MEVTTEILKFAIAEVLEGKNIEAVIAKCTKKQVCMHFETEKDAIWVMAALSSVLDAESMHLYLGEPICLVIDLLSLDIKVAA